MLNPIQNKKIFLVTGSAGFVGFHVSKRLLDYGYIVHGVDLMTASYYDPILKQARLNVLKNFDGYYHHQIDLSDNISTQKLVKNINNIDVVIHLAAQACVLRSFEFPNEYVKDNIIAFQNMLEMYVNSEASLFMYGSSSSVYGQSEEGNINVEEKKTDQPVSIYGATKIANEVMAQSYYSFYKKPMIGLRFFKLYGPWARPDTVFFKFVDLIYKNRPIQLHNNGNIKHSFTFINDVADCLISTAIAVHKNHSFTCRHPIYNFGGKSIQLLECVKAIENAMGKKAKMNYAPLPHGDRWYTFANSSLAKKYLNFKPNTSINKGLKIFVNWYLNEYVPIIDITR